MSDCTCEKQKRSGGMSEYPPRRFICNFVDGAAELNQDDTPPAQEYVSLIEHDALSAQLQASQERERALREALEFYGDEENWVRGLLVEARAWSNRRSEYVAIINSDIPPWSRARQALERAGRG